MLLLLGLLGVFGFEVEKMRKRPITHTHATRKLNLLLQDYTAAP